GGLAGADPRGGEVRPPPRLQVLDLRDLVDPPGGSTRSIADKARTIRIPVHMVERLNRLVNAERRLIQQLGREPSDAEIAAELECSPREVREVLRVAQQPVSLEKPMGEENDSALADLMQDV